MTLASRIISPLIKGIFRIICKVDSGEICKVPMKGPLIVVLNHINFVEVPLLYTHLFPRNMASIVKKETWKNPLLAYLGTIWEAIPLDRNSTDLGAMRKSLEALKSGRILLIAPEGTRSRTGQLQKGHAGVVQIALHSGAPIITLGHYGGEKIWKNLRSFHRTQFTIKVGKPFFLQTTKRGSLRTERILMTDEIMNQLSFLLPPFYRGLYPDPEKASSGHLDFSVRESV